MSNPAIAEGDIRIVCAKLREWGQRVNPLIEEDLVHEFRIRPAPRPSKAPPQAPDKNGMGGFRGSDPDTSRKAALLNYPRSGSQRHKALLAIASRGYKGATSSEVETMTGIPFRSLTPRLGELKHGGWVKVGGWTRRGPMGADQDVLVLTEKGMEWMRSKGDLT